MEATQICGENIGGEDTVDEKNRKSKENEAVEVKDEKSKELKRKEKKKKEEAEVEALAQLMEKKSNELAICNRLHQLYKEEFKDALALHIQFRNPILQFMQDGRIKDINNLMRTDDSLKKSWDLGWPLDISTEELVCYSGISDSELQEVKRYMDRAEESQFFDLPLPEDRPDCISELFYVIYPARKDEPMFYDPMFEKYLKFSKISNFTEKLAEAAVGYHKYMTGSDVTFSKLIKANLYSTAGYQYHFITLEATDTSGKPITCKSRVLCSFANDNWIALNKFDDHPVVVNEVCVQSFCCGE